MANLKKALLATAGWLVNELPKYWKTVAAVVPVVVFVATEVLQEVGATQGDLTVHDLWRIVMVAVAAYGVYKAKNRD